MKKKALVFIASLLTIASCGGSEPFKVEPNEVKDITIHSELVDAYFKQDKYDYSDLPSNPNPYARTDQGDNLPINITWSSNGGENTKYRLVFEESEQTLSYEVTGKSFDFYNYKLNTSYTMHIESGNYKSKEITFTTPSGFVRTVTIDGVSNFRDLGEGKKIKQGLIYRSMTFENNTISGQSPEITEEGIKELKNLGIKSEIDLRKDSERGEKAGTLEGINYQFKPLFYGGQNILTYRGTQEGISYDNPQTIKEILEFLSVKDNYPVDFHCVRGTDRTGCIAYIVKGLLGVEEEYLCKDFIFSNFYNIGSSVRLDSIEYTINPAAETRYVNVIKHEEGDSLQEKIYNYLKNKLEMSTEKIDSVINILKVN